MTTTDVAVIRPLNLPTLSDRIGYAQQMAGSGLLSRDFRNNVANVFFAVEYGAMLGLGPMAALTGIHVIDGKPSASAALVSALVRQAGHRLRTGYDPVKGIGWAEIVRSDDPDFTFRAEWTVQRAVAAGLCEIKNGKVTQRSRDGKAGSWEKYTIAMQKHRSVTECARDACEEALFGLHYTPEELGADVDEEGTPVKVPSERTDSYTDVPDTLAPVVAEFRAKALAATTAAELRELHTAAGAVGLTGTEPTTDADGAQVTLKGLISARGAALAAEEAARDAAPVDADVVDPAPAAAPAVPVEEPEPITSAQLITIRGALSQAGARTVEQQALAAAYLLSAAVPGGHLQNLSSAQGEDLVLQVGMEGLDGEVAKALQAGGS